MLEAPRKYSKGEGIILVYSVTHFRLRFKYFGIVNLREKRENVCVCVCLSAHRSRLYRFVCFAPQLLQTLVVPILCLPFSKLTSCLGSLCGELEENVRRGFV